MRPNILFITCDQLRADALGCYGNPVIRTPHTDALAGAGTRFEQMHVASPVCAPNRGSLATGRWPSVHGLRANGCMLPTTELTLMECLRQAGYATFGAGKMHFKPQWSHAPGDIEALMRGADRGIGAVNPQPRPEEFPFYGFEHGAFTEDNREGPYADYLRGHGLDPWADPHSFTYPQHTTVRSAWPEAHHQTTWVADRSIEFLERCDAGRPFFLWTSFVHPHHPFNPPAPYDTMYAPGDMPPPLWDPEESKSWPERLREKYFARTGSHEAIGMCDLTDDDFRRVKAYYYGMISLIDKQVGRLMETLHRRDVLESTLVVFTSDHGELLGDHHLLFKGSHHDCVTRVPFVIRSPGGSAPQTCATLCQSTDVMPTLLELCDLRPPDSVQGKSLVPALRQPAFALHGDIYIESGDELRTLRTPTARLTWHGAGIRGELYDLTRDPHEFRNLWDEPGAAPLRMEMLGRLLDRMVRNVDPLPRKTALG